MHRPLISFDTSAFSRLTSNASGMAEARAAVAAGYEVLVTESLLSELARAHEQTRTVHHIQRQVDFLRSCRLVGRPDLGTCIQNEIRGEPGILAREQTQRLLMLARNDKTTSLHAGASARVKGRRWVETESEIQERWTHLANTDEKTVDLDTFFRSGLAKVGARLGVDTKGRTPHQTPTYWCLMNFDLAHIRLVHEGVIDLKPNNAMDMDHYAHAAIASYFVSNDKGQLAAARLCQPPGPNVLSFDEWLARMSVGRR